MTSNDCIVQPHVLCELCRNLCRDSQILNHAELFEDYPDPDLEKFEFDVDIYDYEHPDHLLEKPFKHHPTGTDLEASALAGCHLCSLLVENLEWNWFAQRQKLGTISEEEYEEESQELKEIALSSLREYAKEPSFPLELRIGIWPGGRYPKGLIILFAGADRSVQEPGGFASPARECVSTSSEATFTQARQWLQNCIDNHAECPSFTNKAPPTRVIDVTSLGEDSALVRLHITTPEDVAMRYLTLSHCWGGADIYRLTISTMPGLLQGINIRELPKTFQDAVYICRKLRYRYLWIDSLCIIQDDKRDWEKESLKMGSVYQNSVFTIAALGARNSHEGCFMDNNPLSFLPCDLPTAAKLVVCNRTSYPWHGETFQSSKLLRRGWVFQERCLSPRTLYFGKYGIQWECHTVRADEGFPDGDMLFPLAEGNFVLKKLFDRLDVPGVASMDTADSYHFRRTWYEMLDQFTRGDLTFASDKLVAIAGIIELIQARTGLTSFAGLWKEFFLEELLWSVPEPEKCVRPEAYRAPSFSWASVDGIIRHETYQFHDYSPVNGHPHECAEYLSQIIESQVITANEDHSSGRVVSGYIRIRGPITKVKTRRVSVWTDSLDQQYGWTHPFVKGPIVRDSLSGSKTFPGYASTDYVDVDDDDDGGYYKATSLGHGDVGRDGSDYEATTMFHASESGEYPWLVPDSKLDSDVSELKLACIVIARWTNPEDASTTQNWGDDFEPSEETLVYNKDEMEPSSELASTLHTATPQPAHLTSKPNFDATNTMKEPSEESSNSQKLENIAQQLPGPEQQSQLQAPDINYTIARHADEGILQYLQRLSLIHHVPTSPQGTHTDPSAQVKQPKPKAQRHVAGLALVPVEGRENTWRRIGYFEDCYRSDSPQWWEAGEVKEVTII